MGELEPPVTKAPMNTSFKTYLVLEKVAWIQVV